MRPSDASTCMLAKALSVGLLVSFLAAHAQHLTPNIEGNCKVLRPNTNTDQHVFIEKSGCYRLGQTFDQSWRYVIAEGGKKGPVNREMIQTRAVDTEIDLAGFSLKTTTGVDGIVASASRGDGSTWDPFGPDELHRLVVRNGSINLGNENFDLSGADGRGVVSPADAIFVHSRNLPPRPLPSPFRKVEYVLENLNIKTGNAAALLMGDGIVVRNCTIEVEGENALVVYGPNAVIENNRIVYRYRDAWPVLSKNSRTPPLYPELHAAIYLRSADSAIVRGNTISVDERDLAISAVAVVDSKGVRIEGNHLNREGQSVRLQGVSSVVFSGNWVKDSLFRSERALPDQVVNSYGTEAKQ